MLEFLKPSKRLMKESKLTMESLSQSELLTLLSVLEGELEARDLVIEALRAQHRDQFVQERYGKFNLSDPFLALQRDGEVVGGQGPGLRGAAAPDSNPLVVLKLVVTHCRRMQEKMLAQLAAAESRHRRVIVDLEEERRRHAEDTAEGDDVTYILEKERERLLQQLEFERTQVRRLEKEQRRQQEQREEERAQHRQLSSTLAKECKWASSRALEEGQRLAELGRRLEREREEARGLRARLEEERRRALRMEARVEEQLAEFDTEREQLRSRLRREEAQSRRLREEAEELRGEMAAVGGGGRRREEEEEGRGREGRTDVESLSSQALVMEELCSQPKVNGHHGPLEGGVKADGPCNSALLLPGPVSTPPSTPVLAPPSTPAPTPVVPASAPPTQSLPPCGAAPSLSPCPSPLLPRHPGSPNPGPGPTPGSNPNYQSSYQAGIHQRFHAARHKFQGQADPEPQPSPQQAPQCPLSPGEPSLSPSPSPEASPGRQLARSTVTQALSRFTAQQGAAKPPAVPNSSPFGTDYRNLAPSSPVIGRASGGGGPPPLGLRSPTVARADRGNPPPIPPKKPGLAQSPGSPVPGARAGHFPELTSSCGLTSGQEGVKELDRVVSSTS